MPPTIDFAAVADAIAGRFLPAQVTPPAGLPNIRTATAVLPNRLTRFPIVLVMPEQGTLAPGQGSRLVASSWNVRFHYSVTRNLPRETYACLRWLGVLIDQVRVGEVAGVSPPVAVIRVLRYRVGILPYQSIDHTGVELGVTAEITHGWAA